MSIIFFITDDIYYHKKMCKEKTRKKPKQRKVYSFTCKMHLENEAFFPANTNMQYSITYFVLSCSQSEKQKK